MSTPIKSLKDITEQIRAPGPISVDGASIARGIDNYHADVEISSVLTLRVKEVIDQNMKRLVAGKPLISGNSEMLIEVRNSYSDLMKVTMHRTKTDLRPAEIDLLQFAVVKFLIQEVRDALDSYRDQLEETLGQQQYSGSRSLMATQERVQWFRKHNVEFGFRLTRLFLRQFQREENNQLKRLREQILGPFAQAPNVLFNPLLFARSPKDPLLLLDYYAVWPGNGAEFAQFNASLEAGIAKAFPDYPFVPLKSEKKLDSAQTEVYDELGGLFAAQSLLGPSEDQKNEISESFSWLDHPGNMRLLFDVRVHEKHLEHEDLGFTESWGLKGDIKKLQKIAQDLRKSLGGSVVIKKVLASYALREKLSQADLDLVEIEDVLTLVAANEPKKIQALVDASKEGGAALQARLETCCTEFQEMIRDGEAELFVRLLTDFARYRLHLKYYRFAHRVFNRLSVITDPQKIQLAKAGGNLYRLLVSDEVKEVGVDEEPEIVHHAILKADVRGSTTVTTELIRQGLNPASYFSLRFFDPISERLAAYGAVKVFIEGDAVILGVYEYNNAPDEWFSVSRACGIAKEMLDIVSSKNTHSRQTGLPTLEIGIGICYSGERPLFLFDDKRPIMISSAIGDADRMSSCSWRLRDEYDPGHFNVSAFALEERDSQKGEKGQALIRYNVNGVVLDDAAFEKLQTEVHFRRLKARAGDAEAHFFVGQYPDVHGKKRDLVVRQARVGVWRNGSADYAEDTELFCYEVLPNSKYAAQILELAKSKTA